MLMLFSLIYELMKTVNDPGAFQTYIPYPKFCHFSCISRGILLLLSVSCPSWKFSSCLPWLVDCWWLDTIKLFGSSYYLVLMIIPVAVYFVSSIFLCFCFLLISSPVVLRCRSFLFSLFLLFQIIPVYLILLTFYAQILRDFGLLFCYSVVIRCSASCYLKDHCV